MKLIREGVSLAEIQRVAEGTPVKAVVDVDQSLMVVGIPDYPAGELYMLEECGSRQNHLWGVQLHPERYGRADWIEFDAPMNAQPSGNQTSFIQDPQIRKQIEIILKQLVHR